MADPANHRFSSGPVLAHRSRGGDVTAMTMISMRVSEALKLTSSATAISAKAAALATRLTRGAQNAWCVVNGGHYKVLHTEPDRVALRCVACGHMSPGWAVGSPRLSRTMPADPERLRVVRSRMVA